MRIHRSVLHVLGVILAVLVALALFAALGGLKGLVSLLGALGWYSVPIVLAVLTLVIGLARGAGWYAVLAAVIVWLVSAFIVWLLTMGGILAPLGTPPTPTTQPSGQVLSGRMCSFTYNDQTYSELPTGVQTLDMAGGGKLHVYFDNDCIVQSGYYVSTAGVTSPLVNELGTALPMTDPVINTVTTTPTPTGAAGSVTTTPMPAAFLRYDNGTSDCQSLEHTPEHALVAGQETYVAKLLCDAISAGTEQAMFDAVAKIQAMAQKVGAQTWTGSSVTIPVGLAAVVWCVNTTSVTVPNDIGIPLGENKSTSLEFDSPNGLGNVFVLPEIGGGTTNRTFSGCPANPGYWAVAAH